MQYYTLDMAMHHDLKKPAIVTAVAVAVNEDDMVSSPYDIQQPEQQRLLVVNDDEIVDVVADDDNMAISSPAQHSDDDTFSDASMSGASSPIHSDNEDDSLPQPVLLQRHIASIMSSIKITKPTPSLACPPRSIVAPMPLRRAASTQTRVHQARRSLDAHRRVPRSVTPDTRPPHSTSSSYTSEPSSTTVYERLYSPMAAGFARMGRTHRQTQRVNSLPGHAASESSVPTMASITSNTHRHPMSTHHQAPTATSSVQLRANLALVAKMFDGPA